MANTRKAICKRSFHVKYPIISPPLSGSQKTFAFPKKESKPPPLVSQRAYAAHIISQRVFICQYKTKKHFREEVLFGAADQSRTGDLMLTKHVLYQLSHSSICDNVDIITEPSHFVKPFLKNF